MFNDLMTPEQQEEFVRRIWEKQKVDAERNVEQALITEMHVRMQSSARKMVASELKALITPLLEAKREALQQAAETIVDRMATRLEASVIDEMKGMFATAYSDIAKTMAQTFQNRMQRAFEKVLTYDYKTGKHIDLSAVEALSAKYREELSARRKEEVEP